MFERRDNQEYNPLSIFAVQCMAKRVASFIVDFEAKQTPIQFHVNDTAI
jgi:hypothetical protein